MVFNSVSKIYALLDDSRLQLNKEILSLDDDKANYQTDEANWSVAQIVEHLSKTEGGLILVLRKLMNQPDAETFDGILNPPVSFEKIAAEFANTKLKAPAFVVPENSLTIRESLAKLEKSREFIFSLKPALESKKYSKNLYPHPYFGDMNIYQWLVMIGFHELRHTSQIKKILAQFKN